MEQVCLTSSAGLWVRTFIDVSAVGPLSVQPEPFKAFTAETALQVLTDTVEADIVAPVDQRALINVHTGLAAG